jgi:hypothetical protein
MKRKSTIARSPTGWWVASYIERAVWDHGSQPSDSSRCKAWENTILIRAKNGDAAYKKAVRLASSNKSTFSDSMGKKIGRWKFEGLTSLIPLYEEIRDGAEIIWTDRSGLSFKRIRAMVRRKGDLEVFGTDTD